MAAVNLHTFPVADHPGHQSHNNISIVVSIVVYVVVAMLFYTRHTHGHRHSICKRDQVCNSIYDGMHIYMYIFASKICKKLQ